MSNLSILMLLRVSSRNNGMNAIWFGYLYYLGYWLYGRWWHDHHEWNDCEKRLRSSALLLRTRWNSCETSMSTVFSNPDGWRLNQTPCHLKCHPRIAALLIDILWRNPSQNLIDIWISDSAIRRKGYLLSKEKDENKNTQDHHIHGMTSALKSTLKTEYSAYVNKWTVPRPSSTQPRIHYTIHLYNYRSYNPSNRSNNKNCKGHLKVTAPSRSSFIEFL